MVRIVRTTQRQTRILKMIILLRGHKPIYKSQKTRKLLGDRGNVPACIRMATAAELVEDQLMARKLSNLECASDATNVTVI